MENDRIAIVGGVRTPFAKAFTDLTDLNASDLAKLTTQELIQRLDLPPEAIDEVIWGAVLPTMTNLNVGHEMPGLRESIDKALNVLYTQAEISEEDPLGPHTAAGTRFAGDHSGSHRRAENAAGNPVGGAGHD